MAYNKTSEERKWNYWKEQEEKQNRRKIISDITDEERRTEDIRF